MKRIRVACAGYAGRPAAYWKGLDAREMDVRVLDVKPPTLRRWRRDAPETARFVVPVDPAVVAAELRGEAALVGLARTLEVAAALDAEMLLLHTPPAFRPTAERRAALAAFFADRALDGRRVAWRAEGLWEGQPDARDAVCAEGGLIPVVDPLALDDDETVPPGELIYWRLLGRRGSSQRLSDHDLETILDLCADRAGGYVVFGAGTMMGDARRFRALLGPEAGT